MKKIAVLFLILSSTLSLSKTVHIKADFVKPTDQEILYKGSVVLRIDEDDLTLKADEVVVRKVRDKWKVMEAKGKVNVAVKGGELTADSLVYDLEEKKGKAIGKVSGTFVDEETSEKVSIECGELTFDLNKENYGSESETVIRKGDTEVKTLRFVYDKKGGVIVLEGVLDLVDKRKNLKMSAEKVTMDIRKDTVEATRVSATLEVE